MTEPFRNHPIVLVKGMIRILILAAVMLILFFTAGRPEDRVIAVAGLAFSGILAFISFRIVMKTTYVFTEDEMIVDRNTVFKNVKTIPYSKISSVNVVRSIFDRMANTTSLRFNINSGVNASAPDVTLTLKGDLAVEVGRFVSSHITGEGTGEVFAAATGEAPIAEFNAADIVIHGVLSNSTASVVSSILFLAYSIFGLFIDPNSFGGGVMAFLMFVMSLMVPAVSKIVRYYDFKVRRVGDTVYLSHGLLTKYNTSFEVGRVNAVRVMRPFFARLVGKAYIEADVVGINAMENNDTPTVCLLIRTSEIGRIMDALLPEFIYEGEVRKQPSAALRPILFKTVLFSAITMAVSASLVALIAVFRGELAEEFPPAAINAAAVSIITVSAVLIVAAFAGVKVSMDYKSCITGEKYFTFCSGVLDKSETTIHYDRVQGVRYSSAPISRRYGLAKCTVMFLSARGKGLSRSGYFNLKDLETIGDTVMRRIADGSYLESAKH